MRHDRSDNGRELQRADCKSDYKCLGARDSIPPGRDPRDPRRRRRPVIVRRHVFQNGARGVLSVCTGSARVLTSATWLSPRSVAPVDNVSSDARGNFAAGAVFLLAAEPMTARDCRERLSLCKPRVGMFSCLRGTGSLPVRTLLHAVCTR